MTYNQLEILLSEVNIPISLFCKKAGISRQVITNSKSRGGHFSATTENKIKVFFESIGCWKYKDYIIDMNSINGNNDSDDRLDISYKAYEFAKQFDALSEEEQRMLVEMLAFYKSKRKDQNNGQ